MNQKKRDYLFDNYKAFLILLVVMGHFIGPSATKNEFLRAFKWCIVSFHMPAFVWISGYFSKRNLSLKESIQKLAVPYLVFEIIYYLLYTFLMHKPTTLSLHKPKFTLWYLLALFFWRVITPYVKKIPHYFWLTLLLGILIGFSNMENNFLTIPRALVYYPFYLAGTMTDRETISKLRCKKGTLTFALGGLLIFGVLIFVSANRIAPMQVFYGRYSYASLKQTLFSGVFWRVLLYLFGFFLTFTGMILLPEQKLPISYIGTRTLAIYLFHGLIYSYLEYCTGILEGLTTFSETLLLLFGCIGLTFLLSWKPLNDLTGMISKLPVFGRKSIS